MTKIEMAMEMMSTIKWSDKKKSDNAEWIAAHNPKERIERVYNVFAEDREHALVYVTLLLR